MKTIEFIIVGLILLGALFYLYTVFKPKNKSGGGCGCDTTDCKVPKPKIKHPDAK
ncbi:MAG: FeoB-associated Cys-rich membrane protein [Opitutaceae bacterium]